METFELRKFELERVNGINFYFRGRSQYKKKSSVKKIILHISYVIKTQKFHVGEK